MLQLAIKPLVSIASALSEPLLLTKAGRTFPAAVHSAGANSAI